MTDHLARLVDVTVEYQAVGGVVKALDRVTVDLPPASSTAIVGRSGSGKSTLVSVLALMRRPTGGEVVIGGERTSGLSDREVAQLRSREIGVAFQRFHLEEGLTAAENVMLPWFFGASPGGRHGARQRADELLEGLGLGGLGGRRPSQMSGGQRQRVAIARALFVEPHILVADEPTGNLDEITAGSVASVLLSLPERFGTTVVLVTHDRDVADLAERRLELSRGRVSGTGPAA